MTARPHQLIALAAALLLAGRSGNAVHAQSSATLDVALSSDQARVGDVVEATLLLEVPEALAGSEPTFPNWQRHWGGAEIRGVGHVEEVQEVQDLRDPQPIAGSPSGVRRYRQTIKLSSFRPGPVELPSVAVTLPTSTADDSAQASSEVSSAQVTYEVVSVLPVDEEEALEPKPPAPPESLPLGTRFWWVAGLGLALALALVGLLLARRSSEPPERSEPLDPWLAFEQALAKLAGAANPETLFTGLSLELRRYLGRCLAFPAAESTTSELKRRLMRTGLPPSVCADVVQLLTEADSVKFAQRSPAPGRLGRCLAEARAAAATVREHLRPSEAPSKGEQRAA